MSAVLYAAAGESVHVSADDLDGFLIGVLGGASDFTLDCAGKDVPWVHDALRRAAQRRSAHISIEDAVQWPTPKLVMLMLGVLILVVGVAISASLLTRILIASSSFGIFFVSRTRLPRLLHVIVDAVASPSRFSLAH